MRLNVKVGTLVAAAGALAIAVPAAAHPGPNTHANTHSTASTHSSKSHKCAPHNVAYIVSGTVDATTPSTLAANSDGTWSGAAVIDVTQTNHWAHAVKGTTQTYTFTNSKLSVQMANGATSFAAGDPVKMIGKIAVVSKKCTQPTTAAQPVFRQAVVSPAPTSTAPTSPSSPAGS